MNTPILQSTMYFNNNDRFFHIQIQLHIDTKEIVFII